MKKLASFLLTLKLKASFYPSFPFYVTQRTLEYPPDGVK